MLSFDIIALFQVLLLAFSAYWLFHRNDELPILANSLLFYVTGFRFWTVTNGFSEWVDISNFGFAAITAPAAESALNLIFLGQAVFNLAYMVTQNRIVFHPAFTIPPAFAKWLRFRIFALGIVVLPLVPATRAWIAQQASEGISAAFGISAYIYLMPLLLISVATLLVILWKFGGLTSQVQKYLGIAMIIALFFATFSPTGRYKFLGWMLACTIIMTAGLTGGRKTLILGICVVVAVGAFAVAGALRSKGELAIQSGEIEFNLKEFAIERVLGASDGNMLDGFVLLQQVYPKMLDWSMGGEHLAILYRPIPRALWPGKPAAGYMNKLGLVTAASVGTLGISPTLFGDFYQEGYLLGIIFLSAIYGYIFGRLVKVSVGTHPFIGLLLRAMVCAAILPLLRGGDLGGVVAWIGMAFWPCFYLLWKLRNPRFYNLLVATTEGDAVNVAPHPRSGRSRAGRPMRTTSATRTSSRPRRRRPMGRHAPRWGA